MVNRVTLIGNLGKDPEVRKLENGASVAKFSVATDEGYRDSSGSWVDRTEWHDVVAWRGLAERAESNLKKGMLVYVEGKLSTRKWTDQNNVERYRTEIVANYFRILNSRGLGNNEQEESNNYASANAVSSTPITNGSQTTSSPPMEDDDDLPF